MVWVLLECIQILYIDYMYKTYYYYYYLWSDLLFALALGPQFASGFSGNRVNFSNLEGGLASLRIAKEALILKESGRKTIVNGCTVWGVTHMQSTYWVRVGGRGEREREREGGGGGGGVQLLHACALV